jgi:hypothetical protein
MNIFVYSDESGVFDKVHNDIFVFGGLIFLSKEERDTAARKYSKAEGNICKSAKYLKGKEAKACFLSNNDKGKLFRSLNSFIKFGVIINQANVYDRIFFNKKSKQRFLDYAYKIAVKSCLESLISDRVINPSDKYNMYFNVDEHSTATNGIYELHETLEEEFKYGIYNYDFGVFRKPIFPNLNELKVSFCDSKTKPLIRAADIISNKIYHKAVTNDYKYLRNRDNLYIKYLP